MILHLLCVFIVMGFLAGCGPQSGDYAGEKPLLKPEVFFNGEFRSYGIFENHAGKVLKRFSTKSSAAWQGNRGTMREEFFFADGERKTRNWVFTKTDDRHFSGTAPDVVGAAKGVIEGNSLHWVYKIMLPVNGKDIVVTFDDWLTLVDDDHMFSVIKIHKWGLPVGRLTMFFEKD